MVRICRILYISMKIKQTIKQSVVAVIVALGFVAVLLPGSASAVTATTCPVNDPTTGQVTYQPCNGNNGCGVDTAIIKCDNVDVSKGGVKNNGVWSLLLTAINILTAGIGVAVLGGIVYASILYTTAAGNAEQVKKALEFIRNIVIGLVAYALMFAILNFIIPGGLFAS